MAHRIHLSKDKKLKKLVDAQPEYTLMRKKNIEEALDIVDQQLLIKQYLFSQKEVLMLRTIWKKLAARRTSRKR